MSSNHNIPIVDELSVPGSGEFAGQQIDVQVSCELMKNQLPASPIEADTNNNIRVVQDSAGQPLIFTIGSDGKFRVLVSDHGSKTGWKQVDLSAQFKDYKTAATFDVNQDAKGRISLTVALQKGGSTNTDVFLASLLSDDIAKNDWTKLASSCTKATGLDPKFVAERIQMGTSDDNNAPMVIIFGKIGEQSFYYQYLSDGKPFTKLELPENVTEEHALMGVTLGHAIGQRGKFFLYKVGASETLTCITLKDEFEGSLTYDYSPGQGNIPSDLVYNCMTTALGTERSKMRISSDIYVGTDKGIWMFENAKAESLKMVTDQIKDVHEIIVREDADNLSIWAVASPDQLWYIAGRKSGDGSYKWNNPILFNHSVVHIAPIRSKLRKANELFVVDQDLSIHHYWQDPGSTLWQQRKIKVKDTDFLLDVDTFTSQVHVQDKNGTPLIAKKLKITAAEWTYVTANGLVYSLDKDTAAEIPTDITGKVTLIAMASDISTPILHVESDIFEGTLNVYPNGKIHKGLQAIRDGKGADLKDARTQDGKPVVDQSLGDDTLNAAATNVNQLTTAGNKFEPTGNHVFVSVSTVKHDGGLAMAQIPDDFAVGMKFEGGSWQHHSPDPEPLFSAESVFDDIADFAGDALHWMETAFVDGFKYIEKGVVMLKDGAMFVIKKVKEGLQLVLTLADKVLKVVLKTLGAVFKALNWLCKLIGIDLSKILAWLGHLFGLDDIWDTHKTIASIMRSGLDYAVRHIDAGLEEWQETVDKTLAGVEDQFKQLVLPSHIKGASPQSDRIALHNSQPGGNSSSPPANFTNYQIQHGGMLQGAATAMPASGTFSDFMGTMEATLSTLVNDLAKDLKDFEALITQPDKTYENLMTLLSDLVNTVVDVVRQLLDGLFQFARDMFGSVKSALEDEIDIPFLGSFYEFVTGLLGESERLTVINGVSLLIAIPLTVMSKAATGHAPFHGTSGLDDPRLFDKLLGPPDPQPLFAAATADDTGPTFKAVYSEWGGMVGSVAAVGESVIGAMDTSVKSIFDPEDLADNPAILKIEKGFVVAKFVMTFPVPVDKDPDKIERMKVAAWVIGLLYALAVTKMDNRVVEGGSKTVVDLASLILALIADAEAGDNAGTFVADITSNVAGTGEGVSHAVDQVEFELGFMALGIVGALAGIGVAAHGISTGETVQLVNVGG